MKTSSLNQSLSGVFLTLLFVSSASHAEIYKWVDANGQTHYSERKEGVGNAKPVELGTMPQPTSAQATTSSPQYWQEQETKFRQRQLLKPNEKPSGVPVATKPKSLSGGVADESDASRCNLAKDVLSGVVRHPNGAPTDTYDRQVAENDVRAYCR